MKAALCCPGPSLAAVPDLCGYQFIVAVNRAVHRVKADVWAALDSGLIRHHAPAETPPRLLVRQETATRRWFGQYASDVVTVESLGPEPVCVPWTRFTATAALVAMWRWGCTSIDCFGVDWAVGAVDWDGTKTTGMRRTQARFFTDRHNESKVWGRVCEHLAAHGVSVTRRFPTGRSIECNSVTRETASSV